MTTFAGRIGRAGGANQDGGRRAKDGDQGGGRGDALWTGPRPFLSGDRYGRQDDQIVKTKSVTRSCSQCSGSEPRVNASPC